MTIARRVAVLVSLAQPVWHLKWTLDGDRDTCDVVADQTRPAGQRKALAAARARRERNVVAVPRRQQQALPRRESRRRVGTLSGDSDGFLRTSLHRRRLEGRALRSLVARDRSSNARGDSALLILLVSSWAKKKPRSPSRFRRGTTWTWRCGTLWLTRLLIAMMSRRRPSPPRPRGRAAARPQTAQAASRRAGRRASRSALVARRGSGRRRAVGDRGRRRWPQSREPTSPWTRYRGADRSRMRQVRSRSSRTALLPHCSVDDSLHAAGRGKHPEEAELDQRCSTAVALSIDWRRVRWMVRDYVLDLREQAKSMSRGTYTLSR